MSDYKKLTNEELEDYISRVLVQLEPTLSQQTISIIQEVLEYRTKIENGTLIELPCKIKDTVYWCEEFSRSKKIEVCCGKVGQITIDSQGLVWFLILVIVGRNFYALKEDFGKNIFLTKAEAEAKLKELKGEV